MKLATFVNEAEEQQVGVVLGQSIFPVYADDPLRQFKLLDLIGMELDALKKLEQTAVKGRPIPLASAQLLAPIPRPPEFLVIGANYRDHLQEAGMGIPSIPIVTNKQTSSVTGPYDNIILPSDSYQFDYEGELGIIVGKAKRHLDRQEAASAIFGYVAVNDLSVRDWQFKSPTVTLGKSFDTHGPFGPWVVTADEIRDPQSLTITTTVNGNIRQSGHTADMIFDCCEILCYLSQVMTLQPGTIITTGTMAGVGLFRKPPAFLREGDVVAIDISGIGQIRNCVVCES